MDSALGSTDSVIDPRLTSQVSNFNEGGAHVPSELSTFRTYGKVAGVDLHPENHVEHNLAGNGSDNGSEIAISEISECNEAAAEANTARSASRQVDPVRPSQSALIYRC